MNPPRCTAGACVEDGGTDAKACPSTEQLVGPCEMEGLSCETGKQACEGPVSATCVDGEWQPQHVSCNPPPPDGGFVLVDAAPDAASEGGPDGCPPTGQLQGSCSQPGLTCDTGEWTGCGDTPLPARCGEDGTWHRLVTTCNPPPPGVDAGPGDGGTKADAGACPAELPDPGEPCDEIVRCEYGGCVLDWNGESKCDGERWIVRMQNCWTGEWYTLEPEDADADSGVDSGS